MSVRFSASGQDYTSTASVPNGAYTIVCWVMLVVDRNATTTFWTAQTGTTTANVLGTPTDGTTLFITSPNGNVAFGALTVGTWYQTAVTLSGTTATLYGAPAGSSLTSTSGTITAASGFTSFQIGASAWSNEWLNGRIANLKHYSAVLTSTEIATELASWSAVRTANLVRHHKFQVAETADYSSNGNTLSGGVGATTEADPPIPAAVLWPRRRGPNYRR